MRVFVCGLVAAIGIAAHPAFAQADRSAATYWKKVQSTCSATAKKPPTELGKRIAQTAIDEFSSFGGHEIDANGHIFHFGLTEAEHEEDDGGTAQASLGHLGWWHVMKYWRSLFGADAPNSLEVRAYSDASTSDQDSKKAELLRPSAGDLLRAVEGVSDPALREALRESALRASIVDTSWSAAFISYVVKHSGVADSAFQFSNAHRAYIYDAFATSAAEEANRSSDRIYRACPLNNTVPRPGDMICAHRESKLGSLSEEAVRERIQAELSGPADQRTIRRTHCEVVAYVDKGARKIYTIGGNVNQAVSARKLNLRRDLKFSPTQGERCGGPGHWTLPQPAAEASQAPEKCSLNDKKWFVLLQLR